MRILILFILATGFLFTAFTHKTSVSELASEVEFSKGKILFKGYKCTQCHAVGTIGMEAMTKDKSILGADLSGYKTKSAVTVKTFKTVMHEDMSKWDKDSQALVMGFKGTDEELQTILDWLGSLEAQE